MDNLARLPPALNFMHELLGDRNKQYREAFWLTSHFENNEWECRFDKSHTKMIDFHIEFPDGSKLTEPKHATLLDTIKCFLCIQAHTDATGGIKINPDSAYTRLNTAIKLIDYLLLNTAHYKIHQAGLNSLSGGELTAILLDIGGYRYSYQGVYRWFNQLSQFLKMQINKADPGVLEEVLCTLPMLQDNGTWQTERTLDLSEVELGKARAWLYLNNFYHRLDGDYVFRWAPNQTKLAALIYCNTLGGKYINLPQLPELGFDPKIYVKHEYPPVTLYSKVNEEYLMEDTFLAYWRSLQYFNLLGRIGLPIPEKALIEIRQKNIMELLKLNQSGRFRTLPSHVVFYSLRKALEFALTYGDGLVDSYLAVVKAAHADGKTLRQWQQMSVDLTPYLTPLVRKMGVQHWFAHEFEGNRIKSVDTSAYYARVRSNVGLWELLRVLYGAVQMVVGTVMARRYSELSDLTATKCLDRDRRHLIFFVRKSGYDGQREKVARPIPAVAAKLIQLLEPLQVELKQAGLISNYQALFSYPTMFGSGLVKLESMSFNRSLNFLCDYIESPLNRDGKRFYIRQHQLRRFFAMLFFWGRSFGGMDTLRWFMSHTDVEHLYHYITEAMPGEVLRGVQVQYATEQLKAYDKGSEQLADLLEQHFGTRKFDLLGTDELDAYVEDLIKEGQVTVEPEFFKNTDGKDYRILIKIKNKDENHSS